MLFIGSVLGLCTAFFSSLHGLYLRTCGEGFTTLSLSFFQAFTALLMAIPLFVLTSKTWLPPLELQFWQFVALVTLLELFVLYSITKSYLLAEQSLVAPLLGLSIVFMIPIDHFLLDTHLSLMGTLSALLIIIGSFLIKPLQTNGPYSQDKRGIMWMIIAAFFAACAVASIKGAYNVGYSPIPLATFVFLLQSLILLCLVYIRLPICVLQSNPIYLNLYPIVLAHAITQFFYFFGISFLAASYFIGLARSSVIFSVIFGDRVLNESPEVILWRYAGALSIFLGVIGIVTLAL